MAGLLGWCLATLWPRNGMERTNRYGTPLPKQCHACVSQEMLEGRPVFVVGDVHGCFEELCFLLQLASGRRKNPFVIFVGDTINKGPRSLDVLQLVRQMVKHGQAACVRGNHEEAVLRELWSRKTYGQSYSFPEKYRWLAEVTAEDFRFLQELPYTLALPSLSALVVHAGLMPGLPLELQSLVHLINMRSITPESADDDDGSNGGFLGAHLTATSRIDVGDPWASLWCGPQHVYFGHDARRRLQRWPFATGLDTGCLYGGCLTGVFIGEDCEFLEVDALRTYVEP
ncbi:bis(5'-nucleosyl)-tetraphosphatase PrpE [asymmetrical]-like [Babylonia areolata]|uniref:bis(5'-nucleosyl)-tetraphosphatase PrpE [asymmetrical]-like n=1 Tax=Babylonia areolata TaxID=304850 RepID=UPI003FD421EE